MTVKSPTNTILTAGGAPDNSFVVRSSALTAKRKVTNHARRKRPDLAASEIPSKFLNWKAEAICGESEGKTGRQQLAEGHASLYDFRNRPIAKRNFRTGEANLLVCLETRSASPLVRKFI
jgi:hypothetical protein